MRGRTEENVREDREKKGRKQWQEEESQTEGERGRLKENIREQKCV